MAKKTVAEKVASAPPPQVQTGPETLTVNVGDDDHDKAFSVEVVGVSNSQLIVDGCCDEGEAIRCYCVSKKILPNKYRFAAVPA